MAGVKWTPMGKRYPGVSKRVDEAGRERFRAVVWVKDPDSPSGRKQLVKTFDRAGDAKDWREDYGGTKPKRAPRTEKVTLAELWAELKESEDYADATLKRDEAMWSHIVAAKLDRRFITDIERDDIDGMLKKLADRPATREKVRSLVSKLYEFEMSKLRPRVDENPAKTHRKRRTRADKKQHPNHRDRRRLRILSEEELARLVTATDVRWQAMVELMAYVGLRPGEAVALTLSKLDVLKRELTIDTARSGDTKTGEERTITLPKVVVEDILLPHIRRAYGEAWDPEAPMFPRSDGRAISTKHEYDAWRRTFLTAAKRAEVNHGLSPNDLRHHAASYSIGLGATVYSVKNMMGHAKPSITLDVYGYLWDDSAEKLATKLDKAIRKTRKPAAEAKVVALS